jgi:hypothetical protein
VIVSSIRGRVRLRSNKFKNPSLPLEDIRSYPGVELVEHNPKTGSVLIKFDHKVLTPDKAGELLNKLDPSALQTYREYLAIQEEEANSKNLKKGSIVSSLFEDSAWNDTIGLSFALLSLIISGFVGTKKIHTMIGLFFVELVVKHIWRYRSRIKPPKNSAWDVLKTRLSKKHPKNEEESSHIIPVTDVQ